MAPQEPGSSTDPSAGAVAPAAPPRWWLRRVLNRLEIDQAVFFALLLRIWQLLAGLVSVVLISVFFSPEVQGYYYTFSALLALQSFFELGLHIVIISSASHEWSRLRLDERGSIVGDAVARARLIGLGRWIAGWYAVVAVLFTGVVSVAGVVFFSVRPAADVDWFLPWNLLVLFSGLLLWTLPLSALLEGCNQVAAVNRFRLVQAIVANAVVWTAMASGWGLWAAAATAAARLLCDVYLIGVRYRNFFRSFLQRAEEAGIRWRVDIWPMQWRIAVVGVFAYFEFSLYAPVMFYYHGPVLAGQMGMTWTLLMAVQAAALSWVQTRAPRFGMLIAVRDFRELDRIFLRLTVISWAALAAAALLAWSLIWGLYAIESRLAPRLLPPWPAGIFFLAIVLYHVPRCQEIYLRAHKREPTLVANVLSCSLIGLLVWILGARFGAEGAAWGYLAVVALFNLPVKTWLWLRCRSQWHR
jgi:hypothetical protein